MPTEKFTRFIVVDVRKLGGLKVSDTFKEHIKREVVRHSLNDALRDFKLFVGASPIICHNVKFDKTVLENEIEKGKFDWPLRNEWHCTLEIARSLGIGKYVGPSPGRPTGMSYRLEDVASALGLEFDSSRLHSGYYDAQIAGEVYLGLARKASKTTRKPNPAPNEPTNISGVQRAPPPNPNASISQPQVPRVEGPPAERSFGWVWIVAALTIIVILLLQ